MLAPALEGGRYTQKRTRDRRSPISLNALDDTAGFASPGELAAAYREWWRVLVSLRPLILNAFLIVLAVAVVEQQIPERLWDEIPLGNIMSVAETAIRALLLTPVAIAIHRLVILDEVTRAYTLPLGEPAFRVAWLFALGVIADLPFDLLTAMQARDASLAATSIGFLLALIAVVAFALRLTVLLPAIAVAAPGAWLKPALADTKGQALRILAIFLLALLPWIAADAAGVALIGRRIEAVGSLPGVMFLLLCGVLQTIMLSMAAVVASLVFIVLSAKVRQAPAPPRAA